MMTNEDPAVRDGQKGGEAFMHSQKASAAQLEHYLKGIDFPTDRNTIISTARSNGAPESVMQYLNKLPEQEYDYPTDVEQEFGKMK